jgi:hypothetical protein
MFKKLLFLALFIAACIFIERLCHQATDGFEITNIRSTLAPRPEWESAPVTVEERAELQAILAMSFHYLGKGAQSYVFLSEDGKYILKFFKFQHLRLPPLLHTLPLPGMLNEWREAKKTKKESELDKLFQSYRLAFDELKDESGLIFVHLNKSSMLNCKLSLVDRLNIAHKVDADQVEFVLQKRADLVLPSLQAHLAKHDLTSAKSLLGSLVDLVRTLDQKAINDRDSHFTKNFGFIDGRAVLIDCGSLAKKGPEDKLEVKAGALKKWLGAEYPQLLPCLENDLQKLTREEKEEEELTTEHTESTEKRTAGGI